MRVSITWGLPLADQTIPRNGQTLSPTLQAEYVATSDWLPRAAQRDTLMTKVTLVELIPSQVNSSGITLAPINIFVVHNYWPLPGSDILVNQTTIDKWELTHRVTPSANPAFDQSGSRRNSIQGTNDEASIIPCLGVSVHVANINEVGT